MRHLRGGAGGQPPDRRDIWAKTKARAGAQTAPAAGPACGILPAADRGIDRRAAAGQSGFMQRRAVPGGLLAAGLLGPAAADGTPAQRLVAAARLLDLGGD